MIPFLLNALLGALAGWGVKYALEKRGVNEPAAWFWAIIAGLVVFFIDIAGRLGI